MNDEKIINWLDNNGFTDRVDVSAEISLFEYGIIRNPQTDRTLLALTDGANVLGIDWCDISLEDVKEALEGAEPGFYDFIGTTKDETLKHLSNTHLTSEINALRGYCGLWVFLTYNLNKEDITNIEP